MESCPSCGFCPSCGRRNAPYQPPYPGYPRPYIGDPIPYTPWARPTVTWQSNGTSIA